MSTPRTPAPPSDHCPGDLLAWYANGTLPAPARATVEAHLHRCERCRHELASWVVVRDDIKQVAALTPAPGPELLAVIERRLDAEEGEYQEVLGSTWDSSPGLSEIRRLKPTDPVQSTKQVDAAPQSPVILSGTRRIPRRSRSVLSARPKDRTRASRGDSSRSAQNDGARSGNLEQTGPGNARVGFSRRISLIPGFPSRAESPTPRSPTRHTETRSTLVPHIRTSWQLLLAQRPLIRRDIWSASALVLALGWLVSVLLGRGTGNTHGTFLVLVAPLIAALGLSVLYGAENDVALELALATPTSPVQVLLTRFVLVFGYDTLVTLLFSLGFKLVMPAADLGQLLNLWLWPMLFLGALALLLSLAIGTGAATLTSLILWATLVFVTTTSADQLHVADVLARFWHNALPLGLLACACFAGSLLLTRRQEHFL